MYVGADLDQSFFPINDHNFNRVSSFAFLGSPVNDKGLVDSVVKQNIIRTYSGFYRLKFDQDIRNINRARLKAVQNTAGRMMS